VNLPVMTNCSFNKVDLSDTGTLADHVSQLQAASPNEFRFWSTRLELLPVEFRSSFAQTLP